MRLLLGVYLYAVVGGRWVGLAIAFSLARSTTMHYNALTLTASGDGDGVRGAARLVMLRWAAVRRRWQMWTEGNRSLGRNGGGDSGQWTMDSNCGCGQRALKQTAFGLEAWIQLQHHTALGKA